MGKEKEPKETAEKEPVPKKKRGFLGYLMILFLIFVVLLLGATGVAYWKRHYFTEKFLNFYAGKLAASIAEQYQIPDSPEEKLKTEQQIRTEKKETAEKVFKELVKAYGESHKDVTWYDSLKELNYEVKGIFEDHEVSCEELDALLAKVTAVTTRYRTVYH